jgi:hypothetical protein
MTAYVKVAIALALFALGFAAGHHVAAQSGAIKLAAVAATNAQRAQHVAELAEKASEQARAAEHEQAAGIAAIDSQHEQDMQNAKANADRTIAGLRAGTIRLRAEWSCTPALATEVSRAAGGAGEPDAAAQLRAEGAGHLIGNADEADAEIKALQAILRQERGQ